MLTKKDESEQLKSEAMEKLSNWFAKWWETNVTLKRIAQELTKKERRKINNMDGNLQRS